MSTDYYDQHSDSYFQQTKDINMNHIYRPFLSYLPNKGYLLDAGCGSGRDSLFFKEQGFTIFAMDGSVHLANLASIHLQQHVHHLSFSELSFENTFDAIWACASLLHVPRSELNTLLPKFIDALKPNGIFYLSFKYGTTEWLSEGRWFTDFDEQTFQEFIRSFHEVAILELWVSPDQTRPHLNWLNIILAKR